MVCDGMAVERTAVFVRRRVVDRFRQWPVGDVVAVVVADIARDDDHLLAPVGSDMIWWDVVCCDAA